MYLWLKLLHVFFMISWFAGLFYLPRLFVNMAQVAHGSVEYERLLMMSNKLLKFMTPWGVLTVLFGLFTVINGQLWSGWVHAKLSVGIILLAYNGYCWRLLKDFRAHQNRHSHRWYRVFNEVPVFLMLAALYLVVFKPF